MKKGMTTAQLVGLVIMAAVLYLSIRAVIMFQKTGCGIFAKMFGVCG